MRSAALILAFPLLTVAHATAQASAGNGRAASPEAALQAAPADTLDVGLTWLSITNWLLEVGDTRVLLDGYLTRIDRRLVQADGSSHGPAVTDTAELRALLMRAVPDLRVDLILVGHAHWDHAFDVPAIARMTGARIVGARTVCHQAVALGLAAHRCTPVEGGETLTVGNVRVRAVRWHHSGDPATEGGLRLGAPLELRAPPTPEREGGGLRPGFLEDYPNGGGARAYLITAGSGEDATTLFWSNTGNPTAWDVPVPADTGRLRAAGVDLTNLRPAASERPTRDHLVSALQAEGLDAVDVWIGAPIPGHVRQVVPLLRPRAFIPHHWDDLWTSMRTGPPRPFDARAVRPYLDSAGVALVPPVAYFHRFRPVSWRMPGAYEAGADAGRAAARSYSGGGDMLRVVGGATGGFLTTIALPFGGDAVPWVTGGVGLTITLGEIGDQAPPPDLVERARALGPDYSAGFVEGFTVQRRTTSRRAAWVGAGLGALGALGVLLVFAHSGYT